MFTHISWEDSSIVVCLSYDEFKIFNISFDKFLESSVGGLKDINTSMRVLLVEKQNWNYENQLGNIPRHFR